MGYNEGKHGIVYHDLSLFNDWLSSIKSWKNIYVNNHKHEEWSFNDLIYPYLSWFIMLYYGCLFGSLAHPDRCNSLNFCGRIQLFWVLFRYDISFGKKASTMSALLSFLLAMSTDVWWRNYLCHPLSRFRLASMYLGTRNNQKLRGCSDKRVDL